jgi:ABC-type branched-subunit amino acid transport system substrate-binding protein
MSFLLRKGEAARIYRTALFSIFVLFIASSCITIPSGRRTQLPPPSGEMLSVFDTAEVDFRSGNYATALAGYHRCIEEFPSNTLTDNALLKAGDIYAASGDTLRAERLYLQIVTDFIYADTYDEARYKLGNMYYKQGRYTDAVEILKALASDTRTRIDRATTSLILAKSYLMLTDYISAISWFSRAAELTYSNSIKEEAYQNIKALTEGYLDELQLIKVSENFEGKPAGGYASYVLAKRYIMRGSPDDAQEELLKIVRNQPEHEYYYEAQGMLNEARKGIVAGEITVGVILPLSGRASAFGNRVKNGMELASGALGFSDGPKIRLVFRDSAGNPTTTTYAVRELAKNDDVIAIIGPMIKEVATAAAYEAQRLGIPLITLTKERDIIDIGDYVFRNFLTNPDEIRGLVRYIVQARGLCRCAILYPEDAYGYEMRELFSRELSYYGCSIVAEKSYPGETADFRATIKELIADAGGDDSKRVNFDAIFIPDYYNMVGLIIPYVFFFDLKGITLIGTDGWNDPGLLDLTGDFLIGSYFVDAFTPHSNRLPVKRFVTDFFEVFGREPGVLEAYGYDTIKMIQYLVRTQGIDDRTEMKGGLLSIRDYEGVTGYTTIERNGESSKEPFILTVTEAEEEPVLTIMEEPEEGVAIAEELPKTKKRKFVIIEVPDSIRY